MPLLGKSLLGERLNNPKKIYSHFSSLADLSLEIFYLVLLDEEFKLVSIEKLKEGSECEIKVRPRLVLEQCIAKNSDNIILVHNHPSGNSFPSNRDIFFTRLLKTKLHFFDINVVDHVIIGRRCFSFKKANLL